MFLHLNLVYSLCYRNLMTIVKFHYTNSPRTYGIEVVFHVILTSLTSGRCRRVFRYSIITQRMRQEIMSPSKTSVTISGREGIRKAAEAKQHTQQCPEPVTIKNNHANLSLTLKYMFYNFLRVLCLLLQWLWKDLLRQMVRFLVTALPAEFVILHHECFCVTTWLLSGCFGCWF